MDYILGVDPGKTGGLCLLDSFGHIVIKGEFDQDSKEFDPLELYSKFNYIEDLTLGHEVHAILEKVSAMPGQGVSSMFKFGTMYGFAQMAIIASGFSLELVHPKTWTKFCHQGASSKGTSKDRSKEVITRLFPKEDFRRNDRCKIPHEGMIDATLISWYGYCKYKSPIK